MEFINITACTRKERVVGTDPTVVVTWELRAGRTRVAYAMESWDVYTIGHRGARVTPDYLARLARPLHRALEAAHEAEEMAALTADDLFACPGCGCLPGDGLTPGCTHPDGCGAFDDER